MRNNVNLKQLRIFVTIADKGSFVAAAETLHLSQPALSQSIRQLEEEIGSPLLIRTTRRVRLSTLGMSFLPQARHLLRQFDAAIADMQDVVARKRGRVVIACLPSVTYRLMPRMIAVNERLYPSIHVTIRDANLKGILQQVTSGEADCGVGSFQAHDTHAHELDSVLLARDQMHVVLPRDHPLARHREVAWRQLQNQPFVGMTYETGIREIVDQAVASQDVDLRIVAEVSNLATVNGLLEEGIGLSALPGLALPREDHPTLTNRPLVEPVIGRAIRVMWRKNVGLSPAATAVVNSLKTMLADQNARPAAPHVDWLPAEPP